MSIDPVDIAALCKSFQRIFAPPDTIGCGSAERDDRFIREIKLLDQIPDDIGSFPPPERITDKNIVVFRQIGKAPAISGRRVGSLCSAMTRLLLS